MQHWCRQIARHWGLKADLTPLAGEYDLNFLGQADDGKQFVFKVMRPGCAPDFVEMQIEALRHIANGAPDLPFPAVLPGNNGHAFCLIEDEDGQARVCWMLSHLPGRCYANCAPKSPALIYDLGRILGQCDQVLSTFAHPGLERDFKWDLTRGNWINTHLDVIPDPQRKTLVHEICTAFSDISPALNALPRQAIHNDVNDYNILVSGQLNAPWQISGLIDLGDMCAAPRICNLAIAAAYIVLDHPRPEAALMALTAGYHAANALSAAELDLLGPLLRMRLAVSVVNSAIMATEDPDDPYITISQAPAWRFLEREFDHPALLRARMRAACDLPVTDAAPRILAFLEGARGSFAPIMGQDLQDAPMGSLAVETSPWPQNPFHMDLEEAGRVGQEFEENGRIWLGYYHEPRLIYAAPGFRKGPWMTSDRRTVHLAVDAFAPAGTPIHAPLEGRVHVVEDRPYHLDYGGVIILSHETPGGDVFYTLYGHLDPEFMSRLRPGDRIEKGAAFCRLGDKFQNGGWAPHVHFQLALTTEGIGADWPGVGDPDEMYLWRGICPNPAALLNLPDDKVRFHPVSRPAVQAARRAHFAHNLSLTYDDPVLLVRGWKHYVFDEWGRPYLDAYNNVPHVGHAHPRIQAVAAQQLGRINTNTRYLHPAQTAFADKILSKMPPQMEVCFLVNSGSEANELALRLARAATGARGIITPDHGYHGNTTGAIDISAYKFNAPGGPGQVDWVALIDVADDYRGAYGRDDPQRAQKYADQVDGAILGLQARGHDLAGFIAETYPSVGGQIIPPDGYLAAVYAKVRAAGGLCIADEVQTGLGRLGDAYFGFEQQQVTPDIVVLGKPIGNGHPIGVLVTTRAIADKFAEGPEFFSTFGGSTLSCCIGKEVLDIIDDEGLQDNARLMGARLLEGLNALAQRYEVIGDIRGRGLFIGVELITDAQTRAEATDIAAYVKNRMRDHRILLGSEGPKDNILKIRPPLTIDKEGVDMILKTLDDILGEI